MIHVSHVSKQYTVNRLPSGQKRRFRFFPQNQTVYGVKDLSFEIERGETVGYIGLNGAGKSTTIKLLTGILSPTEGEVTVAGMVPYKQRKKLASKIGVVFGQRNQLWWDLPLIDSFELLKSLYSISASDYKKTLDELTEILKVQDFLHTPVRQLSLGQRMRGNLIAALLHRPEVLFLDEPTLGLDIDSRYDFIQFVKSQKQITVFLTSHNMQDIEELCSRILILDKGSLLYDGSLENIYNENYGKYVIHAKLKDSESAAKAGYSTDSHGVLHLQAPAERDKERLIHEILSSLPVEDLSISENSLEGYLLHRSKSHETISDH